MELKIECHWSEDELEAYSMGTFPEAQLELVEEHLLVCGECQHRLVEIDAFIEGVRSIAGRFRRESAALAPEKTRAAGAGAASEIVSRECES